MKKTIIVILFTFSLVGCTFDDFSADDCYGLGQPECIRRGYRTDSTMSHEYLFYDLKQQKRGN